MVGLVMADDLFLLFLFWDLTAVVSYFLIGFDRDDPASRPAALMALLITGGSAILMLAGIVALWLLQGTASIYELARGTSGDEAFSLAVALIAIAALAKSAQVPLHFWLPRAMVAPTPVSSYLHSAAMVAAGVFLIARLSPLVDRAILLPEVLVALGLASMAVGGLLALGRDEMKQLLAYSTIAQYGYVVVMLGLGGRNGAIGAGFYVIAHGLAKCALFLTAGAVTEATGKKRLSEAGGLGREAPLLALAGGIAAAALAALPLTIGFFKDELFFAAMLERGPLFVAAAVAGAGMTFAYAWRFWSEIFLGAVQGPVSSLPVAMTASIAVLAGLCLICGVAVGPVSDLANAAGSATLLDPVEAALTYHLDTRPVNLMALAAYGAGFGMLLTLRMWRSFSARYSEIGERFGPERLYRASLDAVNRVSDILHGYEVQDLRGRVATILVPVGILVGAGLIATPSEGAFTVGLLNRGDLPLVLVLVGAAAAALRAAVIHSHLSLLLLLSVVGYALATVFALVGAPDVALVAVLMETMISLLFIGFLSATRDRPQVEGFEVAHDDSHTLRDRFVGVISGAAAFVVVWGVLSKPAALETAALEQIALTPAAHAKDVVTAILTDFRGLDTMGEITVIGIAMVGLLTLIARPRPGRSQG
jgi:multicomponent Na+:H+ antiporter subunit A